MKRTIFIVPMLIVLALALAACGGSAKQSGKDSEFLSGDDYKEAKALFKQNCVSCHASDLSGLVGAKSNLQKVGERLTPEQIADVITNGRKMMPNFKNKFTSEQINELAEWLSTMK